MLPITENNIWSNNDAQNCYVYWYVLIKYLISGLISVDFEP